ncbi:response regulator transcription factor [Parafilimonas sp.]|uniref:response regulator transcription factor n=1 Tax=Parafilimonas sp. TaxID=1969739 RepID=UPI003F7D4D80
MNFFRKYKTILIYGFSLALLIVFLKLIEYKLIILNNSFQFYAGSIALLFTLLGIWLATKLIKPKTKIEIVEKKVFINQVQPFVINEDALAKTEISARELEVLKLMAKGFSNQEIANTLFVSVSTIKTHISNLFFKLEASRRTQAVEKAKNLGLIP